MLAAVGLHTLHIWLLLERNNKTTRMIYILYIEQARERVSHSPLMKIINYDHNKELY